MGFNGSGVYTLPGAQLANGEIVSATENNTSRNDFAAALNVAWTRDGQAPATGNIPMGNHKLTGMLAGSAATDSINLSQAQGNAYAFLASVTGTDTIAASISPSFAAYTAGQTFRFVSAGANTNATTLNINSLGAKAITKLGTTALIAGDIPSGSIVEVVYDGTQFQLVGLVASTATTATNIAGGSKGQIPVQSASGSTVFMDSSFGFKNRIYNSCFNIWQRSTTYALTASMGYGSADRWAFMQNGTAQGVANQIASDASDARYVLKLGRNAGATSPGYIQAGQAIETANCFDLAGQSVTLSFYAKAGANFSGSNTLYTNVYTGTGVDQSIVNMVASAWTGAALTQTTHTITTSWVRYTATVTIPANATQVGISLFYNPSGTAGADDNVYIKLVQLEKGSTATSFDYRPYGTELALCQRYYLQATSLPVGTAANATYLSGGTISFPSEMRSAPSVTGAAFAASGGSAGTFAVTSITTRGTSVYNSASNWTVGAIISATIPFSSEL